VLCERKRINMRFEVSINGEKACTAGIQDFGVLSAIVTRVKRNPNKVNPSKLKNSTLEEFLEELTEIEITGLDSNDSAGEHGKHVHWLRQVLKAGDEIIIRVLPPGESDAPMGS
jgi:hypothetical protein